MLGQRRDPVEVAERSLNLAGLELQLVRRDDQPDTGRCSRIIGQLGPERLERLLAREKGRPRVIEAPEELADGYARLM